MSIHGHLSGEGPTGRAGRAAGAAAAAAAAAAGGGGGGGALFRQLVVGPHHIIAAVLAKVVLVRTVLPQLVVQLFGVDCTDLLLLCL